MKQWNRKYESIVPGSSVKKRERNMNLSDDISRKGFFESRGPATPFLVAKIWGKYFASRFP